MKRADLRLAASASLALALLLLSSCSAAGQRQTPPPPPDEVELLAGYDASITITWEESPGATSYHIYRGTSSGLEDATPIARTSSCVASSALANAASVPTTLSTAIECALASAHSKTATPPVHRRPHE